MRVLWFTNIRMPAMDRRMGMQTRGSGWWMTSLLDELRSRPDVKVGVATAQVCDGDLEFSEDGVDYFVMSQTAESARKEDAEEDIRRCEELVKRWSPDLIHFHGTERFFGLVKARGLAGAPAVASVQGLKGPYSLKVFGDLSWREVLKAHRLFEYALGWGLFGQRRKLRRWAPREEEILRAVDGALVRTAWDRAHVWRAAPDTPQYHVGETMRADFYSRQWTLGGCARGQILVTTGPIALKGLTTVLRAMALLRRSMPEVKLNVAAAGLDSRGGYATFVRKQVRRLGLEDCVRFLGWLDGEALASQLSEANCFVLPSLIDNSPNSLCEAMLMGLPCVASAAGGITSLVAEGRTGLLFPPGDEAVLAWQVRRILTDDKLAESLGTEARREALRRHDPRRVVDDLLAAYRAVLEGRR